MLTAKDDLESFYHSTRHYKDAASHRLTYGRAFEECKGFIKAEAKTSKQASVVPPKVVSPPKEKSRKSKRKLVHTVKKLGHWVKNGLTPGKRKQTTEEVTLGVKRAEGCVGVCLFAAADVADDETGKLKKGILKRRACKLCGINTATYCTGCNRFLCVDKDRMEVLVKKGVVSKENAKKKVVKVPVLNTFNGEMEAKWFVRSCYQIAHEAQWEKYWNDVQQNSDAPMEPTTLFLGD